MAPNMMINVNVHTLDLTIKPFRDTTGMKAIAQVTVQLHNSCEDAPPSNMWSYCCVEERPIYESVEALQAAESSAMLAVDDEKTLSTAGKVKHQQAQRSCVSCRRFLNLFMLRARSPSFARKRSMI
jgi:hypothetical protein